MRIRSIFLLLDPRWKKKRAAAASLEFALALLASATSEGQITMPRLLRCARQVVEVFILAKI